MFDEQKHKQENEERAVLEAEQEQILTDFIAADNADAAESRTWVPEVSVVPSAMSPFIKYGGVEFPAIYTESIFVDHTGAAPHKHWTNYPILRASPHWLAASAAPTAIVAKTVAGNIFCISVSRHKADALLTELIRVWRENR